MDLLVAQTVSLNPSRIRSAVCLPFHTLMKTEKNGITGFRIGVLLLTVDNLSLFFSADDYGLFAKRQVYIGVTVLFLKIYEPVSLALDSATRTMIHHLYSIIKALEIDQWPLYLSIEIVWASTLDDQWLK